MVNFAVFRVEKAVIKRSCPREITPPIIVKSPPPNVVIHVKSPPPEGGYPREITPPLNL